MIKSQRAAFQKIEPQFGSSFKYETFDYHHQNQNNNFWHYHPEIELVYISSGSGKRQIGSHVSYYRQGDLILIGSNLPHCGFTEKLNKYERETVIQIHPEFLGDTFFNIPETKNIVTLLETAKKGIVFHGEDKRYIGEKIEELKYRTPFSRLIALLEIFNHLEEAKNYTILNAKGFVLETELQDNNRINLIFNFVKEEFKRSIALEEVAELTSMTVPAFCRFFKKITGKTFTQFVNEYRLSHAAKLLHEEQMSITDICFECGFNNFSHFNKQFKKFTGKSPSIYRNELRVQIS
ncbi:MULTISPECIES: AraC family transcriptional regulator [unclassified Zunongwangia]|uniref:AraC family transcriptional regulator n=1 Tax=unclassified Zunongwangia TaxID=2632541 RepID=UPI0022DDD742|nr:MULTISPECIES: AraC family transcriptional regulator [unclassified Zunongwangia]WBL23768.1 AraC family transcriptional regulator [Zunongwangia sp. HRR-M8]WBL24168.1 AraC family transcriptional regulator [Zunongwangia sp. HGR-M22]